MSWMKALGGAVLVLLGLLWIGQGLDVLGGSAMSGHAGFAVLGLVAGALGVWLLWSAMRTRSASGQ